MLKVCLYRLLQSINAFKGFMLSHKKVLVHKCHSSVSNPVRILSYLINVILIKYTAVFHERIIKDFFSYVNGTDSKLIKNVYIYI